MSDTSPWRFEFKLINTIIMVSGVVVCLYLAYWQAGRVSEKIELQMAYEHMFQAEPLNLNEMQPDQLAHLINQPWQPISVRGEFLIQHAFYLDSQVYKGKPGYHFIVPLKISNHDAIVLVNLGWVSAGTNRNLLPEFPEINLTQPIMGQLATPRTPLPGFEQHSDSALQLFVNFEILSDRINTAEESSYIFAPMIVQLDEKALGGLPREWSDFDAKIGMHEFYVVHWLAVAAVIIFLYFYFAYRKSNRD